MCKDNEAEEVKLHTFCYHAFGGFHRFARIMGFTNDYKIGVFRLLATVYGAIVQVSLVSFPHMLQDFR